jgi:hypothetical protein
MACGFFEAVDHPEMSEDENLPRVMQELRIFRNSMLSLSGLLVR